MGLNAQAIGLKIQQARLAKGLSQAELAERLGVNRGTVVRWETGRTVPRQVGIPSVATALGQTPEFLLEGAANSSTSSQNLEILRAERRTLKEIREEVRGLSEKLPKKPSGNLVDKKALDDIIAAWDRAKPEARLIAALLVTGDWSYKLKLWNREVSVNEEVLAVLGRVL